MEEITGLRSSAKAMEESFFRRENERLLRKLREQAQLEERRERLRVELKIENEAVLDRLVELDLSPESVMAFSVVPLVEVAWADGHMSASEIKAVMRAARERGIEEGSVADTLLQDWLANKPDVELMETWKYYAKALVENLDQAIALAVRETVMNRAKAVAKAAGGFLGMKSVSAEEQAVLDDMDSAFE
jgi:hypothetical protein